MGILSKLFGKNVVEKKLMAQERSPIGTSNAQAYTNRGIARYDKGDLDGAIQDFDQAIHLNSNDPVAYFNRGTLRSKKGDLDGAIQDYDQAIRLKPNAVCYYNRGLARRKKGDLDGAIQDYDQAIRLKPDYTDAFNSRGVARFDKGALDGAIQDYNQAIRLKPDLAVAYYNRAGISQMENDYQAAINNLQKFLDLGGGALYSNQVEVEQRIRHLKDEL